MSNRITMRFIGDSSSLRSSAREAEQALNSIGPKATAAGLGIAGIGAASAAAGVVAGAALAGLPLAIAGIGIASAVQSEKVKAAWSGVGDHIKTKMAQLDDPIESQLVALSGRVNAAFDRVAPRLGAMFATVAPMVGQLADGVIRLVEGFVGSGGLQAALAAAGPFITILSNGLAAMGPAIGQFFGNLTIGAGGATVAFQGFFDVINWLIPALGTAVGWLASMLPILGPLVAAGLAIVAVIRVWTIAQGILNVVLAANPIGIVIVLLAGLVAALVYAWNSSSTFRNIVLGAWNAVKNGIGVAIAWIGQRIDWLVRFWNNIPGAIGRALGSLGAIIGGAFRGAMNLAIDFVNRGINSINMLIGGVNRIGSMVGLSVPMIPNIPRFHDGGVVGGRPGSEQLAILQAGETVIPAGARVGGGGGSTVAFKGDVDSAMATAIMRLIREGKIQIS
jgi:phage-related protein